MKLSEFDSDMKVYHFNNIDPSESGCYFLDGDLVTNDDVVIEFGKGELFIVRGKLKAKSVTADCDLRVEGSLITTTNINVSGDLYAKNISARGYLSADGEIKAKNVWYTDLRKGNIVDDAHVNHLCWHKPGIVVFLNTNGDKIFELPYGEQILICYKDGRRVPAVCSNLSDMCDGRDFFIDGTYWTNSEFADHLADIGAHVLPFPEKRIIWSDVNLDLDDWIDDLRRSYPDIDRNDTERFSCLMDELNSEYLDDERMNLDIQLDDDILVIADLGLWNGRAHGYNVIKSGKISDCLQTSCERAEWYVDREGDFRADMYHHDGHNRYLYRKFKPSATAEERDELLASIYDSNIQMDEVDRLTDKIGLRIAKVYGWEFPTEQ